MCPLWEMSRINEKNEILKKAIIRIYKANKDIYGAPRIHHIVGIEGFNISLKRVQRNIKNTPIFKSALSLPISSIIIIRSDILPKFLEFSNSIFSSLLKITFFLHLIILKVYLH